MEAALRRMPPDERSRRWRLEAFSALYQAVELQRADLGPELRQLLTEAAGMDREPLFLGCYLTGLSLREPERVEVEARQLLLSGPASPARLGSLGHVLLHGAEKARPAVEALLLELTRDLRFDSREARHLLHLLGLSDKPSS